MKYNMTSEVEDLISHVNREVNADITYMTDKSNYGTIDFWNNGMVTGIGDCEDYAIAKYVKLLKEGIPEESMGMATCDIDGDNKSGHAVLLFETTDGIMVLDNRYDDVYNINDSNYSWRYVPPNITI
jgi:predicted transglutaminase-like cysteine proteinase